MPVPLENIDNIYVVRIKYLPDNIFLCYEIHYTDVIDEYFYYFGSGDYHIFKKLEEAEKLIVSIKEDIENNNYWLFNDKPEDYDLDSLEIVEFVPMSKYFTLPI